MEDRISVSCEYCGGKFKAKAIAAGRNIACPKCKETITIPKAESRDSDESLGNFAEEGFAAFPTLDLPDTTPESMPASPSVAVAMPEPPNRSANVTSVSTGVQPATHKKFTALKILAVIFHVLGGITAFIGIVFQFPFLLLALAGAFSGSEGGFAAMVMALCLIVANLVIWTFFAIVQFAIGELIELAIQIEYNTSQR